jgi:hypothetical protein
VGAEAERGGQHRRGLSHDHSHARTPFQEETLWVQKLKGVPIIAEDLGVITPDVHELREAIGAPGMVVLQFAWGSGAANTHIPHNHYENSVCYPGNPPALPQHTHLRLVLGGSSSSDSPI